MVSKLRTLTARLAYTTKTYSASSTHHGKPKMQIYHPTLSSSTPLQTTLIRWGNHSIQPQTSRQNQSRHTKHSLKLSKANHINNMNNLTSSSKRWLNNRSNRTASNNQMTWYTTIKCMTLLHPPQITWSLLTSCKGSSSLQVASSFWSSCQGASSRQKVLGVGVASLLGLLDLLKGF